MITLVPRLRLERYYFGEKSTIGNIIVPELDNKLICKTLELSRYGHPKCIPAGLYPVRSGESPRLLRLGKQGLAAIVWWVDNVPGRSAIQIHVANEPKELLGCIAPGLTVNGKMDYISDSRIAFDRLTKFVGGFGKKWELEIVNKGA